MCSKRWGLTLLVVSCELFIFLLFAIFFTKSATNSPRSLRTHCWNNSNVKHLNPPGPDDNDKVTRSLKFRHFKYPDRSITFPHHTLLTLESCWLCGAVCWVAVVRWLVADCWWVPVGCTDAAVRARSSLCIWVLIACQLFLISLWWNWYWQGRELSFACRLGVRPSVVGWSGIKANHLSSFFLKSSISFFTFSGSTCFSTLSSSGSILNSCGPLEKKLTLLRPFIALLAFLLCFAKNLVWLLAFHSLRNPMLGMAPIWILYIYIIIYLSLLRSRLYNFSLSSLSQ